MADDVRAALSRPFEPSEVRFKPAVVKGNRALAMAYVDGRTVMDRLDDVLGIAGWRDEYECLASGAVRCRLSIRVDGEWVTREDVGGASEQPDAGDRLKAAFSDALKRAAVKFGIGRYLYRMPSQWVDYDPQSKQIKSTPKIPGGPPPRPPSVQERVIAFERKLVAAGRCGEGELASCVGVALEDELGQTLANADAEGAKLAERVCRDFAAAHPVVTKVA